ncbi:hypothetical protein M1247_15240 [Mycobacterium sp. 21AC1]|uniref:hypothetical protein n=1 Tax=[Mycobacterium] appelbergii TaxID=2939269 RepID=UPI002938E58F|nr:hypothetical protein [Mycobacterium sp. 21AC1]MDV3126275.1 hypothetical protein [Mycobacterium sp. 21AC1]
MTDNRISATPASTPTGLGNDGCQASMRAKLTARLRSGQLDAMLAVGTPAPPGSPLAVRADRLTSVGEREAIARAFRLAVCEADGSMTPSSCIPLHGNNIAHARPVIDAITLRLHSPLPVNARGMARLNRVLTDGRGPLYLVGSGDLTGRLGAALAAL